MSLFFANHLITNPSAKTRKKIEKLELLEAAEIGGGRRVSGRRGPAQSGAHGHVVRTQPGRSCSKPLGSVPRRIWSSKYWFWGVVVAVQSFFSIELLLLSNTCLKPTHLSNWKNVRHRTPAAEPKKSVLQKNILETPFQKPLLFRLNTSLFTSPKIGNCSQFAQNVSYNYFGSNNPPDFWLNSTI